jgi:hypothetical protein
MSGEIPRRIRLDQLTPAEMAIAEAVAAVERAGAHPLLTDAVVLLGQARAKVADFIDQCLHGVQDATTDPREHLCPQRIEGPFRYPDKDTWRSDDTCSHCGSMNPDILMKRLEAGNIELGPTDKSYKVYVKNAGGENVLAIKFYFQHLNEDQKRRFVELLNESKLKLGMPGHFYRLPFSIQPSITPAPQGEAS